MKIYSEYMLTNKFRRFVVTTRHELYIPEMGYIKMRALVADIMNKNPKFKDTEIIKTKSGFIFSWNTDEFWFEFTSTSSDDVENLLNALPGYHLISRYGKIFMEKI